MKYEEKYLKRLAEVYMDKHDQYGFDHARVWYKNFLTPDLRKEIKPYVQEEVKRRR